MAIDASKYHQSIVGFVELVEFGAYDLVAVKGRVTTDTSDSFKATQSFDR